MIKYIYVADRYRLIYDRTIYKLKIISYMSIIIEMLGNTCIKRYAAHCKVQSQQNTSYEISKVTKNV